MTLTKDEELKNKLISEAQANWAKLDIYKRVCGSEFSYYDDFIDCGTIKEKRIAELEAQIEKMKCCGNCNGILDGGRRAEKCRYCMNSKELREWELGI